MEMIAHAAESEDLNAAKVLVAAHEFNELLLLKVTEHETPVDHP